METVDLGEGECCCRQLLSGIVAPSTWKLDLDVVRASPYARPLATIYT